MATDLERLVVQLSADIKQYQRGLQNAMGVTNKQARAIENRWKQSEKNLNAIGAGMASGLLAPLGGIAAALTAREVLVYADAWTKAKNSLAVAGVTGVQQTVVLDRLYQSAQKNATPIGALADLYGKAAQASDNLGASNQQLIDFSDGVATALKVAGTGASEASGALTQLGQLLGSARVQAEEFNSVNEGARPILIAVANGLDAAGGSVNKLKQLVNDGKVSGQQFFQAFLKGLPTIQAMAANSTQTIEQGVTKVANAFTKYIGQTDESLGATQRLVAGLNALADNFQETADIVVQLASIIAGALVGRSIALMIAKLGVATTAVQAFVAAIRAAATTGSIASMLGGISAAAGPIGLVVGGTAVAALALFSATAGRAADGARGYAEALRQVEAAAKASAGAVGGANSSLAATTINELTKSIKVGEGEITTSLDSVKRAFAGAFDADRVRSFLGLGFMSAQQRADLEDLQDKLGTGKISAEQAKDALYALANSNPAFQPLADGLAPLLDKLSLATKAVAQLKDQLASLKPPNFRESENASMAAYDKMATAGAQFIKDAERKAALSKDQLDLEKQIAEVQTRAAKAGVTLTNKQAKDLAQKELAAEERRKGEGKDSTDEYDRQVQSLQKSTEALKVETETLGKSTYEIERAKAAQELWNAAKEAGREQEAGLTEKINEQAEAHARAAAALADAQKKQEANKELTSTLGNELVNGIADLASGAQSLNDILNDTSKLIAKLILQALLLGQGPLASMFGTSSGGGLLGSLGSSSSAAFGSGGIGHAASGGQISGPGTGTSDSIPTMLSDGEYVIRASQARKHRALLDAINSGKILRRAAGGPVNMPSIPRPGGMGGASVQIVNNTGVQAGARTETTRGPNGQAMLRVVLDAVRKDYASGGFDSGARGRFGLSPAPVRRG